MFIDPAGPAAPSNHDLELPPIAHAGRPLVPFDGGAVQCDWQRPTSCREHAHPRHLQITVFGDGANCVAGWRLKNGRHVPAEVSGGEVWIIPAGVTHQADWRRAAPVVSLYVEGAFSRRFVDRVITAVSVAPLRRYTDVDPLVGDLCGGFWRMCRMSGPLNADMTGVLAQALAGQLLFSHFAPVRSEDPMQWQMLRTSLADVRAYVEDNLEEDLSLEVLAAVAKLSPSYFGQLFRAATGLPPSAYVAGARVRRACELLGTGRHSATAVAHLVGFRNQAQMNASFRRMLDAVPSDYLPGGERNHGVIENRRKRVRWRF